MSAAVTPVRAADPVLDAVRALAEQAGERILAFYGQDAAVEQKADASPLTLADRAAHEFLCEELRRVPSVTPVLSEESETHEYELRRGWTRFWLVDPLDGTKEFLKRTGEFTVNVALVEGGEPVLGVIRVPVLGLTYFARRGQGGWCAADGEAPRRIRVRRADPERLAIVASRDHAGPQVQALIARLPGASTLSMGSSLKFCLVAEGKADLYLRDVPTMEWDTAAAQCIVEEAGGRLTDLEGLPLRYNKESLRNPALLTVGDPELRWQDYLERPRQDAALQPEPLGMP